MEKRRSPHHSNLTVALMDERVPRDAWSFAAEKIPGKPSGTFRWWRMVELVSDYLLGSYIFVKQQDTMIYWIRLPKI
jgi:hypothetical protein